MSVCIALLVLNLKTNNLGLRNPLNVRTCLREQTRQSHDALQTLFDIEFENNIIICYISKWFSTFTQESRAKLFPRKLSAFCFTTIFGEKVSKSECEESLSIRFEPLGLKRAVEHPVGTTHRSMDGAVLS